MPLFGPFLEGVFSEVRIDSVKWDEKAEIMLRAEPTMRSVEVIS